MYEKLTIKKESLDRLGPIDSSILSNLEDWFNVELTYTSNAIEGNTLTRIETALVAEKGITIGKKTLREHLEVTNHIDALQWVRQYVSEGKTRLTEQDILTIHRFILSGIDNDNAGKYRSVPVRIAGDAVVLPNPNKVPNLMQDFMDWLVSADASKNHPVALAAEAHYRLVTIHPFVDGNGRTARLLMNLLLLLHGYPPAIIRKRDRLSYINALEDAQLGGPKEPFYKLICRSVERSLDIYMQAQDGEYKQSIEPDVLKIGQLAKKVGEENSTIRYWTKKGLLHVAEVKASGHQLYDVHAIEVVRRIQALKKQRFTLEEIKVSLDQE